MAQVKKAAVLEAIKAAAFELFAQQGYGATSMPGIARAAGISTANVYVYFGSKLAVLYAEGIDGSPDYKAAAEWFRKSATHGVTDSQYNLAVLYARGIGVGSNMVESYKWFALAAANGDTAAAKKRDEVAARLDQQALMAGKLAAQTFIPEREPEEATNLKAPPGGWDPTATTTARPRRPAPASTAQ